MEAGVRERAAATGSPLYLQERFMRDHMIALSNPIGCISHGIDLVTQIATWQGPLGYFWGTRLWPAARKFP